MKLNFNKMCKCFLSFLLIVSMVFGIVGVDLPGKVVKAASSKDYTVTMAGTRGNFYLGNKTATTSEYVVLTYTVKENSVGTATVGNNGVVATTNPNTQYPYHQVGSMHFNGSTNWLMKKECTYTLKLYLDDNGFITVDGKYKDAAGKETAGLILGLGNKTGAKNKGYQYFGIYIANAVSGTLTNVSCVDAEGNDLGLMSNQSDCVITENKAEEEEITTGYTVTMAGTRGNFYLGNKTATTSEYVVLTYTVKENSVGTATVGNNGVVATTNPNTTYPYTAGSMHFNGSTNWLMRKECRYTLKLYLDDNGFITVDGKYEDAAGKETAGLILGLGNKTGAKNKDYQYFGIYIANAVSGTLTNVSCVDAEGNDLGLMSNQSDCVIEKNQAGGGDTPDKPDNPDTPEVPEIPDVEPSVLYNVTLGGVSSIFLGNKTATKGPIILRYTVESTDLEGSVGNNGVVATTKPTEQYPYTAGSMRFNGKTNYLMKEGCTYTLKLWLDKDGFITVDGKYVDADGKEVGGLILGLGSKAGANKADCNYMGIYIEKEITANLTNVSCIDTEGNDLGLQVNQLGCTIVNITGPGGDEIKEEKLDPSYKMITLGNFGIEDGTYKNAFKQGAYALSMHKTVFSVDIEFSKDLGEDLRFGSKVDGWHGLRFWSHGNNLRMEDVDGHTDTYTFDMMVANMKLVGEKFNLKISTEYVDSDDDGVKDDVKLGVWFNDRLYDNKYIYLQDYKNVLGKYIGVYSAAEAAYITVGSVEGVLTGVDYSIWGWTNNWKKEMGIE